MNVNLHQGISVALNIKNQEVERLTGELSRLTGETKTETIRRALEDRRRALSLHHGKRNRAKMILEFLKRDVWPNLPKTVRSKALTKKEREKILGYGPEGV